jgi:hypothetical protein
MSYIKTKLSIEDKEILDDIYDELNHFTIILQKRILKVIEYELEHVLKS